MQQQMMFAQSERLRLVAIFNFVGSGFAFLLFAIAALVSISALSRGDTSATPEVFGAVAVVLGIFVLSLFTSGVFILQHKHRWFSILVGVLFLPFFPIGTAIGCYCFWHLGSPLTKALYAAARTPVRNDAPTQA